MNETRFYQGLTWQAYLDQMTINKRRILGVLNAIQPDESDIQAARAAIAQHSPPISITILTEDWCGDAVVNIPVAVRFAEITPGTRLRLFTRSHNPDLEEAYALENIFSIPIISFFDGEWREIGRFVEHTPAARDQKAAWMAQYPEAEAWRHSSDPELRKRWQRLLSKRLLAMIQWYKAGLWRATWYAFIQALNAGVLPSQHTIPKEGQQ